MATQPITFDVPHPIFTPADIAVMTSEELAFFTDAPLAHVVARNDYQRQSRLDRAATLAEWAWLFDNEFRR